jgi:translation initiation factor 4A
METYEPERDNVLAKEQEEIVIQEIKSWDDLNLKTELLRGIYNYGFENPSPIQKKAILPIIQGRDIIAQAQSGSGKTGTFTIGMLERVNVADKSLQAVIIAPTHELVKQIAVVVNGLAEAMDGIVVKTMVGGTSVRQDIEDLRENLPHVIIGTAGRIYDLIRRRELELRTVKMFVLDEADEMLAHGFKDQIYNIFQFFNNEVQVVLFSATLPDEFFRITSKFMRDPVKIVMKAEELNLEGIDQRYVALQNDKDKFNMLKQLFEQLSVSQCIIYVNSIGRVNELYDAMTKEGFSVCCIHSSMNKEDREQTFLEFCSGSYRVMISSNITARGIDIQQVSTVVNFDIPRCVHTYLHRIGRSGRWGRKGLAINFITRQDVSTMQMIERHYKMTISEWQAG